MPLLDHFRPPLSDDRPWEGLHGAWVNAMADALNPILPEGYYADGMVHAGRRYEVDVPVTHPNGSPLGGPAVNGTGHAAGGVAVADVPKAWAVPAATATLPVVLADDFEVRVVTSRGGGGRRLIAAIELVSPANKDRPDTRRAFAAKVAGYLYYGVSVIVVDVVTERTANLHHAILDLIAPDGAAGRLADHVRLYAVAYRPVRRGGRPEADLWVEPLAVGSPMPTLPLWLTADEYVPLDLEATYLDMCRRRMIRSS